MKPCWKPLGHEGGGSELGGPRPDIDLPTFHRLDHAMVLGRSAIAARQDGSLAAVDIRVEQRNVVVDQANEDQLAALLEQVRQAGTDVLVTGSSFFSSKDPSVEVMILKGHKVA